jgi:hypothetical protein
MRQLFQELRLSQKLNSHGSRLLAFNNRSFGIAKVCQAPGAGSSSSLVRTECVMIACDDCLLIGDEPIVASQRVDLDRPDTLLIASVTFQG